MADGSFPKPDQPLAHRLAHRAWDGFEVALNRTDAGKHTPTISPLVRMALHVGPAVRADCCVDDVSRSGWQSPGDYDLVPPGVQGQWEDATEALVMSFRFSPELMARAAEGLDARPGALTPQMRARDPQVELIGQALRAELEAAHAAPRLYGESLGLALAARLAARAAHRPPPRLSALTPRQLRAVTERIEAHLDEDLSLTELAATAGVSVSHFTVMFRRAVGQSAHRYLMERRVLRAQALLARGGRTIAQAAGETGFAHQSHLARCMRRMLGVTPAQLTG
ncbi:helix-turn-helix domain-containing protein [Phenylobacterium aquaticum]|uniref:helix-turn-helix domain-containing protein n=1 Tax=Phenylobacterium aquaticum TaxID=1763816 RepID=UPI0026EAEB67|nr:AraC family transcriptional regulator [Phenylobacterium aquaticum]